MRLTGALQSICRAPEDWKRRLRPALVRVVDGVRRLPGGRRLGPALRRLAPDVHAFLFRRYNYYSDAGLGQHASAPVMPDAMATLGPRARRVALWMQPASGHDGA